MDALNIAVEGNFTKIPPRWKAEPFLWRIAMPIKIFHFSGSEKPSNQTPLFNIKSIGKHLNALVGTPWNGWVRQK